MKVADLIALLAPLSERTIHLRCGDTLAELDREHLAVIDENLVEFWQPAPPARTTTLADALGVVANWMKQAESRITALEEKGTGDIDYSELANEVDLSDLAGHLDVDDAVTDAVNDALRYARFRME